MSEGEEPPIAVPAENAVADAAEESAGAEAAEVAQSQELADLRLFVGPNAEKFLTAIDGHQARRRFAGLCWAGFFFPLAWFLYRKLYGWAALCCLAPVLTGALNLGAMGRALVVATSALGLGGQRLYVAGARATIAQIRASSQSDDEARETIRRAGGVSTAGAVIGGLVAVLSVALAAFAGFRAGFNAVHLQQH